MGTYSVQEPVQDVWNEEAGIENLTQLHSLCGAMTACKNFVSLSLSELFAVYERLLYGPCPWQAGGHICFGMCKVHSMCAGLLHARNS